MIILKELLKEEKRADGACPVVIRIRHNGKSRHVPTSLYTSVSSWDYSNSRLNENDCDYKIKNEIIESIYRRVSGSIQDFIDNMLDSKLDDIINPFKKDISHVVQRQPEVESLDVSSEPCAFHCADSFIELIDLKAASAVSHNTRRGYEGFRRYVEKRFGYGPSLGEINQDFSNKFVAAIDNDYRGSESMRRYMISRYNAVVNFGRDAGFLPKRLKIALPPYCLLPADRNLTGEEICNIFQAFSEAIKSDPEIKKKETEALGVFILDIAFQGLAPVDLANLRVKALNFRTLHAFEKNPRRYMEDEEYRLTYDSPENRMKTVIFSTTRKKTGRPVQIVAATVGIEKFILGLMSGKGSEDYLLPCYDSSINYSVTQRQNRLANYFNMLARNLNKGLSRYYKRHDLGDHRRITFYFARHAFCNLVDGMDIPRHIIQNMVGHRSSVLETSYLRPISLWEQAKISHALLSRYFV